MENRFKLTWNADAIALAFNVTVDDIEEYLTDGRRVSFIIERRLKWLHEGWELAPSEGAGYDLRDPSGGLWEVRSITNGGVYFNPSGQVGSGRTFNETGFAAKLGNIKGFILSDIVEFPDVEFYVVPVANVIRWHKEKLLGKSAKIGRKKFLKAFSDDIKFDEEVV